MATISQTNSTKGQEAEYKKYSFDMKQTKANHAREYDKVVREQKNQIDNLQTKYEVEKENSENELQKKLGELKRKQQERITLEEERFNAEMKDLKVSHDDQLNEKKISYANELKWLQESNEKTLANAKQKFEQEKAKYGV